MKNRLRGRPSDVWDQLTVFLLCYKRHLSIQSGLRIRIDDEDSEGWVLKGKGLPGFESSNSPFTGSIRDHHAHKYLSHDLIEARTKKTKCLPISFPIGHKDGKIVYKEKLVNAYRLKRDPISYGYVVFESTRFSTNLLRIWLTSDYNQSMSIDFYKLHVNFFKATTGEDYDCKNKNQSLFLDMLPSFYPKLFGFFLLDQKHYEKSMKISIKEFNKENSRGGLSKSLFSVGSFLNTASLSIKDPKLLARLRKAPGHLVKDASGRNQETTSKSLITPHNSRVNFAESQYKLKEGFISYGT